MRLDPRLDGDDRVGPVARVQLADRRRGGAVDDAGRQMPQQIDDIEAGGALDQLGERRPDAGQHRYRREKPVENGGTHRSIYGLRMPGWRCGSAWLYRRDHAILPY